MPESDCSKNLVLCLWGFLSGTLPALFHSLFSLLCDESETAHLHSVSHIFAQYNCLRWHLWQKAQSLLWFYIKNMRLNFCVPFQGSFSSALETFPAYAVWESLLIALGRQVTVSDNESPQPQPPKCMHILCGFMYWKIEWNMNYNKRISRVCLV